MDPDAEDDDYAALFSDAEELSPREKRRISCCDQLFKVVKVLRSSLSSPSRPSRQDIDTELSAENRESLLGGDNSDCVTAAMLARRGSGSMDALLRLSSGQGRYGSGVLNTESLFPSDPHSRLVPEAQRPRRKLVFSRLSTTHEATSEDDVAAHIAEHERRLAEEAAEQQRTARNQELKRQEKELQHEREKQREQQLPQSLIEAEIARATAIAEKVCAQRDAVIQISTLLQTQRSRQGSDVAQASDDRESDETSKVQQRSRQGSDVAQASDDRESDETSKVHMSDPMPCGCEENAGQGNVDEVMESDPKEAAVHDDSSSEALREVAVTEEDDEPETMQCETSSRTMLANMIAEASAEAARLKKTEEEAPHLSSDIRREAEKKQRDKEMVAQHLQGVLAAQDEVAEYIAKQERKLKMTAQGKSTSSERTNSPDSVDSATKRSLAARLDQAAERVLDRIWDDSNTAAAKTTASAASSSSGAANAAKMRFKSFFKKNKVVPHCAHCTNPTEWSDYAGKGYALDGWNCVNFADCGSCTSTIGSSRWFCTVCQTYDLCGPCFQNGRPARAL